MVYTTHVWSWYDWDGLLISLLTWCTLSPGPNPLVVWNTCQTFRMGTNVQMVDSYSCVPILGDGHTSSSMESWWPMGLKWGFSTIDSIIHVPYGIRFYTDTHNNGGFATWVQTKAGHIGGPGKIHSSLKIPEIVPGDLTHTQPDDALVFQFCSALEELLFPSVSILFKGRSSWTSPPSVHAADRQVRPFWRPPTCFNCNGLVRWNGRGCSKSCWMANCSGCRRRPGLRGVGNSRVLGGELPRIV